MDNKIQLYKHKKYKNNQQISAIFNIIIKKNIMEFISMAQVKLRFDSSIEIKTNK